MRMVVLFLMILMMTTPSTVLTVQKELRILLILAVAMFAFPFATTNGNWLYARQIQSFPIGRRR